MAETYTSLHRPERTASATSGKDLLCSGLSGSGSDTGPAATSEARAVHERGGVDELDISKSATDDEKASVGRKTPGVDCERKISFLDLDDAATGTSVSRGQLQVIVETGGSSLDKGLRRVRTVPENLLTDTIETDNKRRPAVQRENRLSYWNEPKYYPDDSQSVAKSVALKRVKQNLEEWEKQIVHIESCKFRSDKLLKHEVQKRNKKIAGLEASVEQHLSEIANLSNQKDLVSNQLKETSKELSIQESQVHELTHEVQEYHTAYEAAEQDKQGLSQQLTEVSEELERSENVRKRLNEEVTELQVQLDMERQRSKSCTLI
ncbi:cingulin-like isoform X2 [Corticium candelabrum]|uniref:cingulin-like isoform X2 n=1 Tax=Corticium candelabrum TaxID=121492 RepID=UPI002E25C5D2|nr:cingulin-like isoform X2 [Corticium candelabrum]